MLKSDVLTALAGRRIFMTGGTGFFGKSLISYIRRREISCELAVLSRDPEKFIEENPEFGVIENLDFIRGDARSFEFPSDTFDLIIHAATPARVDIPDTEMSSIIIDGTRRILDYASASGAERLLFTSSGAVYGIQPEGLERIPETFPCSPVTVYGKSKLEAEKMCVRSGVDCVIARCFAFTGFYLDRNIHYAIGNFLRDALRGHDIVIKGDGTPFRSYLYSDDLAEWLLSLLVSGRSGEAYNVGSPFAFSIASLALEVKNALGSQSSVKILKKHDPASPVERYVPDVSKIRDELGVSVTVPLAEAIRRSVTGA